MTLRRILRQFSTRKNIYFVSISQKTPHLEFPRKFEDPKKNFSENLESKKLIREKFLKNLWNPVNPKLRRFVSRLQKFLLKFRMCRCSSDLDRLTGSQVPKAVCSALCKVRYQRGTCSSLSRKQVPTKISQLRPPTQWETQQIFKRVTRVQSKKGKQFIGL